ncbi:MAG: toll/interleukin-1 receptor domain-containing protein [Candidatus Bathyarchaeia archaeon]
MVLRTSEFGLDQPFNVFISHASEDMNIVDIFAKVLSWNNVNPLVAEYFQEPGTLLWKEKVKRLINQCHFFVVLYTYNAQNKVKVHQEIGSAGIKDMQIIVLLEESIDRMALPGYLEGLEVIENFRTSYPSDGFNNLTHILLNRWYSNRPAWLRREVRQFYGCNEAFEKIMFKFDDVSAAWNRYRYDSTAGTWVLIP